MIPDDVNVSDAALIGRCRAGDREAFGGLVTRYQHRLYGALSHLLGSMDDARDVCQDAFVLAYRKLDTFRGDAEFYSWLFRIAYNAAMTRRRKRRPRQSLNVVTEKSGFEPSDERSGADPTESLQSIERQQLVQNALNELAEDYRTVLVLKEIEGLQYDEIAEICECPIGTVRSRIHRARNELREALARALQGEA
jgi:RNA polymerase sigma-70 factor (ECF subfamily)